MCLNMHAYLFLSFPFSNIEGFFFFFFCISLYVMLAGLQAK